VWSIPIVYVTCAFPVGDRLPPIASAHPGEPPLRGRDAYRFVLSNPDFNVCMTGPKNAAELEEALAALDEGPLSAQELERVRRIGEFVRAHAWMG